MTMRKLFPRKIRLSVYAFIVVGVLVVAGVDGVDPGLVADWIDKASRLSGAVAGLLALANLKPDEPKAPTE
jgi:hypothetical protein